MLRGTGKHLMLAMLAVLLLPAAALTPGTTATLAVLLLPAAALTPGTTTVPPPKATQNWWDAFFAPAPQPLLVREKDGMRLRRGTREDAPRIRQLWAANVAPNSLGEAWSPGGIETAFVYRKTRDRLCGNQNLGAHLQNCICAMAWTTRLTH